VAVFNRTTSVANKFAAVPKERNSSAAFRRRPRENLATANGDDGQSRRAVDDLIEKLIPMESGDVIIDGGNEHYTNTERRTQYIESKKLLYVGTGVSGGEEGALKGPSLMPGGSEKAWPLIKPIFQAIAAKVGPKGDIPCCEWVGPRGAGHYVNIVHNGIEYGDSAHLRADAQKAPNQPEYDIFAGGTRGNWIATSESPGDI
jgi:6-phosphogluconate dehydrogenase